MAIGFINTLLHPTSNYSPFLPFAVNENGGQPRFVQSKNSHTFYDGSVVTTIIYTDGTTETETEQGDHIHLSAQAQALLHAA